MNIYIETYGCTANKSDESIVKGLLIKNSYSSEELIGKQIAVLVNLEPRKIRGQLSQGMLLAAQGSDRVSVLTTDKEVGPGSQIR